MKVIKISKKQITVMVLIIAIITFISTNVLAVNTNYYEPTATTTSGTFYNRVGIILGWIKYIGILVAVVALTIIGIRYLFSSVEGKAEYKKTMMPYILGCFLLVGTSTLVGLIADVADTTVITDTTGLTTDQINQYIEKGKITVDQLSDNQLCEIYMELDTEEVLCYYLQHNLDMSIVLNQDTLQAKVYQECKGRELLQSNGIFLRTYHSKNTTYTWYQEENVARCDRCGIDLEYINEKDAEALINSTCADCGKTIRYIYKEYFYLDE